MDFGGPKEARDQLYSPGGTNVPSLEGKLAPPGEYDWTIRFLQITLTTCYYYLLTFVFVKRYN